jgi:hypothetical protein
MNPLNWRDIFLHRNFVCELKGLPFIASMNNLGHVMCYDVIDRRGGVQMCIINFPLQKVFFKYNLLFVYKKQSKHRIPQKKLALVMIPCNFASC